jgi:putative ABC transport system permease protein
MFRVALKGLLQRKSRLLGTMLAIVLGVGFISGVYVLTDTLQRTFDDLFGSVYATTDVVIQPIQSGESRLTSAPNRMPVAALAAARAIDGVAYARGYVQGYAQVLDTKGEPIGGDNKPAFGTEWDLDARVNPFRIAEGRAPVADGEIAIDRTTAKLGKLHPGDRVSVLTSGPAAAYTIVGISTFGTADSAAGLSSVAFGGDASAAMHIAPGYDQILLVAQPGLTQDVLAARTGSLGLAKVESLTGKAAAEQRQSELRKRLSGLTTILLIFGYIAVFVGAFVIANTFAILIAQRRQELALLRAIGAARTQILTSILVEAGVIGVVASLVGVVVGIGIAQVLKGLFSLFQFSLPTGQVVLLPRTVIVALVVGSIVTMIAAIVPSWRASRIAPIAALRESAIEVQHISRLRVAAGLALVVVTGLLTLDGFHRSGNPAAQRVGLAAGVVLVASVFLGPLLVTAFARASQVVRSNSGHPTRRARLRNGMSGQLARQNVLRSPRRASLTGIALTLGLAIVSLLLVFASSFKALLNNTVEGQFKGDFVVLSQGLGFTPEVASLVAATPGVQSAAAIRIAFGGAPAAVDPNGSDAIAGVDAAHIDQVITIPVKAGRLTDLDTGTIAIGDKEAAKYHVSVGDPFPIIFATGERPLRIAAIVDESKTAGIFQGVTRLISLDTWDEAITLHLDTLVIAKSAPGQPKADVKARLKTAVAPYSTAKVLDQAAYKAFVMKQVNGFLGFVFVMLTLSIVIAGVGVWNTLNLSVIERTRELGLLRGIGMTRRQARTMVRHESVIISVYGALVGIVIGVASGIAIVRVLREQGFTIISVPFVQLAIALLAAFLLGVAAAIGAARRASRLDILTAISAV